MFFMVLSAVVLGNGLIILGTVDFKVKKEPVNVAGTPAQRFVPLDPDSPRLDPTEAEVKAVVVIAHGFGGSQRMMWPFASTFARNGYAAESFDFPGHGSDTTAYTADDAQRLQALDHVVQDAHTRWPGKPVVLLGHGMGAAIAVQYAHMHPIAATIAVSLGDRAPADVHNLLLIPGSDQSFNVWNTTSMRAAVAWVDRLTGTTRPTGIVTDVRMLGLGIVVLGLLWFWWSLCYFLFRRHPLEPLGAHLPWRSVLLVSLAAAVLTPLI
ncbi:MAG: alpha/beta fold hydrolase, partial [Herpetosiphonaceae bacterium]|nr:alpha/beta fold hydrolase [Herpetosiphonaceae bacterium]